MKEVLAVVRRNRAAATKRALETAGFPAYTAFPVLGRGAQRGLGTDAAHLPFLAKTLLVVAVEDGDEPAVVQAIVGANRTGEPGDGKIFVRALALGRRVSEPAATEAGA